MGQLRAVENGRTVLQAATTGKSAVIGPDGGIRASSGALFTPDVLVARVPLRTARTIATRTGAVPEYLVALLAVAAIGYAVRPGRRSRRRPAADAAAHPEEMVTT
jgi:apolipoprotein N-acyltransferase